VFTAVRAVCQMNTHGVDCLTVAGFSGVSVLRVAHAESRKYGSGIAWLLELRTCTFTMVGERISVIVFFSVPDCLGICVHDIKLGAGYL
jgi:hypothetical protein